MAMGIVSNKDFEDEQERLTKSEDTIPIPPEIHELNRGRGKGNVAVPEALRKIIGEEAITNGRAAALDIAKDFGISPSSVSAYTQGATSTATIDNPTLEQLTHLNNAKQRISKRAKGKLLLALSKITEEKLENAKIHEISGVARDMATIMDKMEPKTPENPNPGKNGPTFVFFKPEVKSEEDYTVIHVRE